MEAADGHASFVELIDTVKGTIKNLQNKRSFLQEQQPFYEHIFDRIDTVDKSNISEEEWQYGEVIYQNGKLFQNVGYDYYLEKSKQECLEFIKMRIALIKEAISQFDEKLEEAHVTLENMESLRSDSDALQNIGEDEIAGTPEDFMEIREELDEDGNVIDATVTPANNKDTNNGQSTNKGGKHCMEAPGQQLTGTSDDSINEKLRNIKTLSNPENMESADSTTETPKGDDDLQQISEINMYTFDDLVDQLEKLDNEEDGEVNMDDIEYDFEGYQDDDDANDDDDDDDFDYSASIVPERAQQSFMSQIRALRENRFENRTHSKHEVRDYCQEDSNGSIREPETKSILKKSSTKKKSVNFAPTLDVFEVENVKHETKSNTFNFPRCNNFMVSEISEADEADVDFDADLFAQMIGAKNPDELHEKYQPNSDLDKQESVEEFTSAVPQKKRVSRFKKEKQMASKTMDSRNDATVADSIGKKRSEPLNEAAVVDIVERDESPSQNITTKLPNFLSKKMTSLQKPKPVSRTQPTLNFSENLADGDVHDIEDNEAEEVRDSVHESAQNNGQQGETAFPKQQSEGVIAQPKIDFAQLEDVDDMARAYLLGLYDDDVEDPGALLQSTTDFDTYNKLVETLKPELEEFMQKNPGPGLQEPIQRANQLPTSDGVVMNEIIERDPMADSEQLLQDVEEQIILSEIEREYIEHRRRNIERIASSSTSSPSNSDPIADPELEESLGKEPIDEFGNPVTTSRFKTQSNAARKHLSSQSI
ncbi:unnamed protein product [Kluyveromyces dobzhanskii CBS 2104]|uniref:WGS project CCBQ000000000 data, contig 00058 n=1 Tax=Kluyveromyces dobzhanskii CBS 2104 TaxID=1427455 RepID=A0A0A8LDJ9_9SACH|nr:unnamed protein product [Kluyveromyces dobzhanskii CBS 2104]